MPNEQLDIIMLIDDQEDKKVGGENVLLIIKYIKLLYLTSLIYIDKSEICSCLNLYLCIFGLS